MYYRNTNAAFLVFDITDYSSFVAIKSWATELKRNVEQPVVLFVIGNKIDLSFNRKVSSEECKEYAASIGACFYETSALTEEGIDEVILATATGIYKMSEGENDVITSLKIYDDNSCKNITDKPLSEEALIHSGIAHGIHEKPYLCC